MATPGRARTKEYFPKLLLPVSLSTWWATANPASARDPPILAGRPGSVSYEVTAVFPWVLVCTGHCGCLPRVASVSPRPMDFLWSNSTDFQSQMLRGLISSVQLLWAGSLIWGLELLVLTGSLWSCDILPTCRLPCQGYGSSPDGISTRLVLQGSFFIFFL